MAKVVGIKDPLLRLDFLEIWTLQEAMCLMKKKAKEGIETWSRMHENAVVAGDPYRVRMYQGFLSDEKRHLRMAEQLYDTLVLLDKRRHKRVQ